MDEATLQFQRALQKQIGEKTGYNKDLLAQQRDLNTEISALPSSLREQFNTEAIRDPFAQERIIAARKGALGSQAGFLNSLLEGRGQRFSDIVGNTTQGVQAILNDRARATANSGGLNIQEYLNEILNRQTGEQPVTGGRMVDGQFVKAIDPNEARYNALVNEGYSDAEAFQYATQGIPQDVTAPPLGAIGRFIQPSVDYWRGLLSR